MGNCSTRLLSGSSSSDSLSSDDSRDTAAAPADEFEHESPPVRLRSMTSDYSTHIVFVNEVDEPVKLYWYNYDGAEVPYRTLAPGHVHRQQTFLTHPWTFKAMNTRGEEIVYDNKRVVFPKEAEMRVVLQRPQPLDWSVENHTKHFPEDFVDATKMFLMCHNRYQREYTDYVTCKKFLQVSALPWLKGSQSLDVEGEVPSETIGILPSDVMLQIVRMSAPYVPYIVPTNQKGD